MKEFDLVSHRMSSKIEGSQTSPIELEVGEPVAFSNIDEIYEQIVKHSLVSIKYNGESVEKNGTTYQKGQNLLFIRECSLSRMGTEIQFDYYKEEEEEEKLLHQYYPYFVGIANRLTTKELARMLMINGVSRYIPSDANKLRNFLNYTLEVPRELRWKHGSSENYLYYRINKSLNCLERTKTFQNPHSQDKKINAHTHFIIGDDEEALLFSGKVYEHNGLLKELVIENDLFCVSTKGEANVIYVRLDEDDIEIGKNIKSDLEKEHLIENVAKKSLNHELLGASMTFTPNEENEGGKFILSPVVHR